MLYDVYQFNPFNEQWSQKANVPFNNTPSLSGGYLAAAPSIKKGDAHVLVFGGAGGMFMLEEAKAGSRGTMPNGSMSDTLVEIWNLWHQGDHVNAENKFSDYVILLRTSMQSLGIANWLNKHILVKKGVLSKSFPRSPSLKPEKDQFVQIDRLLDKLT